MTDQLDRLPSGVRHLRCDNPGPMTLTGTNTYVIALEEASGGDGSLVAVVDPGPEDAGHRDAIMDAVRGAEATRVVVLLTHHHDDHEGGASALVEALRGRGLAVALRGGSGGDAFADGEMIGDLQVLLAPGHTRDSAAFVLQRDGVDVLFSGDTILGEGSSFVAYPDGDLTAYLATLDVLMALVAQAGERVVVLAPGHGPVGADAAPVVERYRAHRQERLDEVRTVLADVDSENGDSPAQGDELVGAVVDGAYSDIGPQLRPAVEAVVKAQLAHLGRL